MEAASRGLIQVHAHAQRADANVSWCAHAISKELRPAFAAQDSFVRTLSGVVAALDARTGDAGLDARIADLAATQSDLIGHVDAMASVVSTLAATVSTLPRALPPVLLPEVVVPRSSPYYDTTSLVYSTVTAQDVPTRAAGGALGPPASLTSIFIVAECKANASPEVLANMECVVVVSDVPHVTGIYTPADTAAEWNRRVNSVRTLKFQREVHPVGADAVASTTARFLGRDNTHRRRLSPQQR